MLFLEKLEQKKLYIILVIVICMLIGIMYAIFFVPEKFVSSTSIMLMKTEENEKNELKNDGNLELTDSQMATFEELIKSDSNIQEAKKNLNLNTEINRKNVSVKRISSSDTFQIKVSDSNSESAVKINSEITKIFGNTISSMYKNIKIYVVDEAHIVRVSKVSAIISLAIYSLIIGILIDLLYIISLIGIEKNVKNVKDIESNFSLKVLGLIPLRKLNKNTTLILSEDEKTSTNKAFRKLRSNIQFLNINNNKKNIILITNCSGKEGKSYVSANLAISYANVGKKVILIDSDLNKGNQFEIFNIPNDMGLSNFLSNLDETGVEINERINSFIKETNIKNLNIITSGTIPPNSSELLSSEKFSEMLKDLSVFYDVVILDGTPISNRVDSLILSRYATSSLIISIAKKTNKDDLWKAKRDIQNVGGRIIGIVLNKVKIKEEKEERITSKILENLKQKIKEIILKLKNNRKQKLLNESTIIDETTNTYYEIKKEEQNLNNVIVEEKIKSDTDSKLENVNEIKNEIQEKESIENSSLESTEKLKENDVEHDEKNEEEKTLELNNVKCVVDEKNSVVEKKALKSKLVLVKKTIRKILRVTKIKTIKSYRKIKEIVKNRKNNSNSVKQDNNLKINKEDVQINKSKSDNAVLVIVDANNEVCRAFSKNCYTEKLVRGLDTNDGFVKAHYSAYLVEKRVESLMLMYTLTKKQASRIDPLVYATLIDYDEHIWVEQKTTSNKAESYVLAMAKDYDKNEGENKKDYIERCKSARKEALEQSEIEIEYNIDLLWNVSKMKFSDKVAMNRYAKIYGKINHIDNDYDMAYVEEDGENKYIEENIESVETESENKKSPLIKINPLKKIEEVKNTIVNVKQVKAKTVKELEKEIEIDNKLNEQNNYVQENFFDMNSSFSEVIVEDENERHNAELQKQERRREAEVLKKIQKEKIAKKRKEERTRKQKQKEERDKQREEQRRAREIEREKKMEEARIEEELLGDNLYPKTKYNKNL